MAADIPSARQKTLGSDKNYDTKGRVAELRQIGVTPHVAQNTARPGGSAIDGHTTRHEGRASSSCAARERERCVWPERDRLQPDPPGQPDRTSDGGVMSRWLHRGVTMQQRSGSPNSTVPTKNTAA